MRVRSCVHPDGRFVFGLHSPSYKVANLREGERIEPLGRLPGGESVLNLDNFPAADLEVEGADEVYEIVNPFPFRGTTFISSSWAVGKAHDPASIRLPAPGPVSLRESLEKLFPGAAASLKERLAAMPGPFLLTLAATSSDPEELTALAGLSCELVCGETGEPEGFRYKKNNNGRAVPAISDHELFEVVVNNPRLPAAWREVMVLRPGAQGASEIVGEYREPGTHVFEYMRRNSYIPWGHYAANMSGDAIRYAVADLSPADMRGLRHLYYQRVFVSLAAGLGLPIPQVRRSLEARELEELRLAVLAALKKGKGGDIPFSATLWGWNFGFDYSGSGYRLHASHQQIHQQYALIPSEVAQLRHGGQTLGAGHPAFACGDLIADFCELYQQETGRDFFSAYLDAIRNNRRMDTGGTENAGLVVHEEGGVILFVPKAQTSQWELQIMAPAGVGNVLAADAATRAALDRCLLMAQQILARMGARMVSSIEFSSRFAGGAEGQRLLYALLPRLPYSMGAMSEAQLRWVCGHFPEDFAAACRLCLDKDNRGV